LLVALLGCISTAEPQIVIRNHDPIAGPLYLIAAKEKREIRESLSQAGVDLTDDLVAATAVLRVTLGVEKSHKGCGAYSNVKYAVRINRERLLELTGAGWTGTCEPLIYDEMSALLSRSMKGDPR
jgi:hypothetical protein